MKFQALLMLTALAVVGSGCAGQGAGGPKVNLPKNAPSGAPLAANGASNGAATATGASDKDTDADLGGVLTGTTLAHRSTQVSAAGSGLLAELKVREGDFVTAGQVIATLDRRDSHLRAQQAEAVVKSARVQLAGAERELARLEKLAKDSAVPAADVDRLTTARDAAKAGVEMAEAALAVAHKSEGDADVRAPFGGLVTARLKGEGEWISTMPPAPLIALVEVTPLDLKIDVPAALLTHVKAGDPVTVRLASVGREIATRITRIVPQVVPQTRMFTVYAELPNDDHTLAPGLFAEVRLAGSTPTAQAADARRPDSAGAPATPEGARTP